jgi:Cu2+-exporting ATPase
MLIAFNAILVGATAVVGAVVVDKRRKLGLLVDSLAPQEVSSFSINARRQSSVARLLEAVEAIQIVEESKKIQSSLANLLTRMDAQYQHFMTERVDQLLGRLTVQEIESEPQQNSMNRLSPQEKRLNRDIGITGAIALLASVTAQAPFLLLITLPASLYILSRVYQMSYQALFIERRLKIEVLWAVWGTLALFSGYMGALGFSLMLDFLTSKLIIITQERSHQKIVNVFGRQPRKVWVLVAGIEVEVPFEQVQRGDVVIAGAGQMVPVDGVIVDGMATIDQHTLTGEAQPAEKGPGDTVFATTLVLGGKIYIQVEKAGQDSVAAQIGKILNSTSSYQVSLESRGVELANQTILPRLIASALALPISGIDGAGGILGCGIGTAIRFSAPIAMLNFLNQASRNGILVKDGRSLELLNKIDTIVFDKTGTLTVEQPTVGQIHAFNPTFKMMTTDELLYYAAAAEYQQTHPIAKAILAEAANRAIVLPSPDHLQVEIGYGIKARLRGKEIHVGSHRYMALIGIDLSEETQILQMQCQADGRSLVFIALDGQLAGAIELLPTIRPEAKVVIDALHERGHTIFIISGDQEEPTRKLAQTLGIDHYYANTLPENKAQLVEELQRAGRNVCFVGDGINDSIALKKANVSISLLGASTVATDTAQIVLMDRSLQQLPELLSLAHHFNKNVERSFAIAIVPGILFIGGVFLFHWGIFASIWGYNATLFASIGNAMLPALTDRWAERSKRSQ